MGPSWMPLLLWIIYCVLSKWKWKPKAKGPPWNLLSFVLPSGRSYFCSLSSSLPIYISILSAWLPRKCAWRKKISACSWSLGSIVSMNQQFWTAQLGKKHARGPAEHAGKLFTACASFATSAAQCIRSCLCPGGAGTHVAQSSSCPQVCVFLTPSPNTDLL